MGENSVMYEVNCVDGLLDLLNEIDITGKAVCEIGCWLGVSTQAILSKNPSKLYAVDVWGADSSYNEADWAKLEVSDVEKKFRETMSEYNNVEIIKNFSVEAAKQFKDKSLYFVYIDANHNYYEVMKDIEAWLPKVQDGGYIAGHDTCIFDVVHALDHSTKLLPRIMNKSYKTFSDSSWLMKVD